MERPGPDASSSEIAEWMERDFWEGIEETVRELAEDAETDEEE
jgi:hypothetical protein